ncbi:hypothetical protein EUGRSUZ_H01632 [Eucalyptus grandis]|uniref:Uncharacterized protein n=2 Tax=Eucalyptus grandis TaxID=71139 RepID=A0ACC3JQU3_EUCGR|nr:hypothetical protein EUGRSUZ_H01632 [Eucalyptus grandis]
MNDERQRAIEEKTEDGESGSKGLGVEWGLGFPLEFHLDEVDQHGNKKGENGVEGSEVRGTSDICLGMTADSMQLRAIYCSLMPLF